MAEKYTYSITDDFPNQKVDASKLAEEIRESDISTALDYINTTVTICDIWFKAELSTLDSTATLPAVIAAHDGERSPDEEAPTMDEAIEQLREAYASQGIDFFEEYGEEIASATSKAIMDGKDVGTTLKQNLYQRLK